MKETQIDLTLMGRVKVVVVSMGVLLLLLPLTDCIEKEPEYLTTHSAISPTPSGEERQPQEKKELTVELIITDYIVRNL